MTVAPTTMPGRDHPGRWLIRLVAAAPIVSTLAITRDVMRVTTASTAAAKIAVELVGRRFGP